jgi:hypothetical protein
VLIAGNDEDAFADAVLTFVDRCVQFNATLNDAGSIPRTRQAIVEWGRKNATEGVTFLGEVHRDSKCCNTERNVAKLRDAFQRLQSALIDSSVPITRRNLAATISLALFLADTLQVPLYAHFALLRLFGRAASQDANGIRWDDSVTVTPEMVTTVGEIVGPLLRNEPVAPTAIPLPSLLNSDYSAIAIVDACATGFGALVWLRGRTFVVKGGWRCNIRHSAWAEPLGAIEVLRWLCKQPEAAGRIAVVTDHIALALAQRRPLSGNCGFGRAHFVNAFMKELYEADPTAQVFYVKGEENPADAPSRQTRLGEPLTATATPVTIPALSTFLHPFALPPARKWWNV